MVGEWIIEHSEGQNAITEVCSEKSENVFKCLTKRGLEQGRETEVTWNGKTYIWKWKIFEYEGVPDFEEKSLTWWDKKESKPTPVKWLKKIHCPGE